MAGPDWEETTPLDASDGHAEPDDAGQGGPPEYEVVDFAADGDGAPSLPLADTRAGGERDSASAAELSNDNHAIAAVPEPAPSTASTVAAPIPSTAPPAEVWASLVRRLEESSLEFDFFQAVRRIETTRPELPPVGQSWHPRDDAVRFCQEPSLSFAPSTVSEFHTRDGADGGGGGEAPRLFVNFLGLLGPNGPLPLHLTDYARDRERNHGDAAMARFFDLFNHRVLSLFYRAWACNHQAVGFQRGDGDRFADYFASLCGLGLPPLRNRDAVADVAKLHFAGRLVCQTRHAEGLRAILKTYFGVEAEIVEFVGQWVEIPVENRCRLGESPDTGAVGVTAVIGSRIWDCQQKFRVRLGPMRLAEYQRLLPGGDSFRRLVAWVRNYAGDAYAWDVQLVLKADEVPRIQLGSIGQLGWTTWTTSRPVTDDQHNLVLQPSAA